MKKSPRGKHPSLQPCVICHSFSGYRKVFDNFVVDDRLFDLYVCTKCGLGITHPFPEKEHIDKLYSSDQYRDNRSRFILPAEKLIQFFRKTRCRRISKYIRRGRILDIGCARGVFLSLMREEGWETYGLELNNETASYARDVSRLDVKTGALDDARFPDEYFDVITIWHVLEHLPDPLMTIKEASRILRSGGRIIIAIPNFDSLQAKMSGKHWFHLDIPYHLYHFNLENLQLLLRQHSFEIQKVWHFSLEFNPFGYLQSFLNMCGIKHNLFYNILKKKSIRKSLLSDTRRRRLYPHFFLTLMLLPAFIPISLFLSFLEALIGQGGTIEVHAVKKAE